jgi:hypothetical protein
LEGTDTGRAKLARESMTKQRSYVFSIIRYQQRPCPKKKIAAITTPILQAGLPCSGIVRFPRALAYGPIEYQGPGIPNLYTSQGISHIERILKYSHLDDDITGQLI